MLTAAAEHRNIQRIATAVPVQLVSVPDRPATKHSKRNRERRLILVPPARITMPATISQRRLRNPQDYRRFMDSRETRLPPHNPQFACKHPDPAPNTVRRKWPKRAQIQARGEHSATLETHPRRARQARGRWSKVSVHPPEAVISSAYQARSRSASAAFVLVRPEMALGPFALPLLKSHS